jgi:hypothetical protein
VLPLDGIREVFNQSHLLKVVESIFPMTSLHILFLSPLIPLLLKKLFATIDEIRVTKA